MNDSIIHRFRMAMAQHFDRPLTPEIAAAIELATFTTPDRSLDLSQFPEQQCGRMVFRAERLSEIVAEIDALTALHWQETEKHRHGIPMKVDYDAMVDEERAGTVIQFTARDGAQLVGNFRLYLRVSRHTQTPFAWEDTLYLLPDYRAGRNAKRFLFYARDCLRPLGYREFRATVKKARPAAARLLEHCGFEAVATEYVLIEKEPPNVQ
jgi:GNAT superfamily N-acetyltransferase